MKPRRVLPANRTVPKKPRDPVPPVPPLPASQRQVSAGPSLRRILSFFVLAVAALALVIGIARTNATGDPTPLGAGAIAFLLIGWLASHLSRR